MQLSDRTGSRIRLQDLHVLISVVQAGSMGKAARALNTTQPNISRAIGELEAVLGVRLLDRHRGGVEPTEYGRALIECGTIVFDDLRQGVKNIELLTDPAAGELRIGTTAFLAASFVAALVEGISRRYPRAVFHLVTGYMDALHRELNDRKVDLLVLRSSGDIADDRLNFEFLFDDSYVVAAGVRHRWARRRRIEIAELANEPWVLPPRQSVIGSIVTEAFRAGGLGYPRVAVVTDSPHMRISLLAGGRFVTVLPASALKFLAKSPELKVLKVKLPVTRRPNGIVTLKNRELNRLAQVFIDEARDVARSPEG